MKRILKKLLIYMLVMVIIFSGVTARYEKACYCAGTIVVGGGIVISAKVVLTLLAMFGITVSGVAYLNTDGGQELVGLIQDGFKEYLSNPDNYASLGYMNNGISQEAASNAYAEFENMITSVDTGVRGVSDAFMTLWGDFCGQISDAINGECTDDPAEELVCTGDADTMHISGRWNVINSSSEYYGYYWLFNNYTVTASFSDKWAAWHNGTTITVYIISGNSVVNPLIFTNLKMSFYKPDGTYLRESYVNNSSSYKAYGIPDDMTTNIPVFSDYSSVVSYLRGDGIAHIEDAENYKDIDIDNPSSGIIGKLGDLGLTSGLGSAWTSGVHDYLVNGRGYVDAQTGEFVGVRGWDWVTEKIWEKYLTKQITFEQLMAYINAIAIGVEGVTDATGERVRVPSTTIVIPFPDVLVGDSPVEDGEDSEDEKETVVRIPNGIGSTPNLIYDLTKLFPFCVPFDLVEVMKLLKAEPETPVFEVPIVFEPLEVNEVLTINLSIFDPVIQGIHIMLDLLFIVGLIMITRNLIKG